MNLSEHNSLGQILRKKMTNKIFILFLLSVVKLHHHIKLTLFAGLLKHDNFGKMTFRSNSCIGLVSSIEISKIYSCVRSFQSTGETATRLRRP